ncbi:MAG: FAD-dependent oxidoreductase [Gammaproteobacteria bacterium]
MPTPELKIKNGQFKDTFDPDWLKQLDGRFLQQLHAFNPILHEDLLAYRHHSRTFSPTAISELLLACAPSVEQFIAELYGIEDAVLAQNQATLSHQPVFAFKQWYVQRQARRRLLKQEALPTFEALEQWLAQALIQQNLRDQDPELAIATLGQFYLQAPEEYAEQIESLTAWCIRALTTPEGQARVQGWVSFQQPKKLDYYQLVTLTAVANDEIGRLQGDPNQFRIRDGFQLTDHRMTPRQVLNEVDYCVYCHDKAGDFCSKGFPVKKGEPDLGFKINPLGDVLTGCPLEEKISEMHVLKRDGYCIASLAMIMVDNPMCPATGHRICNDCMKACIYQKQEPVNIPQTETGVLTDVLGLPWGVEVYDLLTRWNPLRQTQWVAQPYNGTKVLVMGMGPAGFSLAHHLLMAGCAVVGVDGLKIEPLPEAYLQPIHHYTDIKESLDSRIMAGFGGVAEYGITVRWDKNFLKLIYISLSRRPYFQVFGGVRFGGTLTVEDAWKLGFNHMAIAVGAGLPKALPIPGSMAPGMRQANDFLMALQLTGAAKKTSLANLQVRLPAVVIGGGLTGIDTATEVQAYYIAQVEKTLERYEKLSEVLGEARLREQFDAVSFEILEEFLQHGRAVRALRAEAAAVNQSPNFLPLLREWGGVTVAYRRSLRESPAYTRNHEEVIKAFEEGIYYAEGLTPKCVRLDAQGQVEALISESRILDEKGEWVISDEEHVLPARAIFVATGARPNIAYEFEHRGTFQREGEEYQPYHANGELEAVFQHGHCKIKEFGAFTSYQQQGKRVTFLGDTHPIFHGSVVKAIASGKRVYPEILETLGPASQGLGDTREYQAFAETIHEQFQAELQQIIRHTPSVIELRIKAPLAARNFAPGHFYRIQNFETYAQHVDNTLLQTEATAILAAGADPERGLLSLLVLEQGASTRLLATLPLGTPISVMGPTGVKTKIPQDQETILILGGRLSAAQLLALGPALKQAGNRVLYVGGFKSQEEVFCQSRLEAATDKIIWATQAGEPIPVGRPQDRSVKGDLISALTRYAKGELDGLTPEIPLQTVNRIFLIGKYPFLEAMQTALSTVLKHTLTQNPKIITSVYGPMQCMLKGVCAQCLVWQVDPQTGKRTKAIFACSWHHQPFEGLDIHNLQERLVQNRMQETLTNLWLDYLLTEYEIERI